MADRNSSLLESRGNDAPLEQQLMYLQALERVSRRLSAEMDMEGTLCAIVDACQDVFGASRSAAALLSRDGRPLRTLYRGLSRAQAEVLLAYLPPATAAAPAPPPLLSVRDVAAAALPEDVRAAALAAGLGAFILVPLTHDGRALGVVGLGYEGAQDCDDASTPYITSFAALAATSLVKTRLFEQVQESRNKFRDLYDDAPDGYHSVAADGTILEINNTELAWLGYRREHVLGKMKLDAILTAESGALAAARQAELQQRGFVRDLRLDLVRLDGSVLPVVVNASAIYDRAGNFLMSHAILRDVSHLKRLQEHNALLASFVESISEFVIASSLDGAILYANPAAERAFGYEPGGMVGQPAALLLDTRDPGAARRAIETALHEGRWQDQVEIRLPDASLLWLDFSFTCLRDEAGRPRMLIGVGQDISESKSLQQQLLSAQKMESLGTLAGGIAHDFNNLLGGILGYASLLKSELFPDDPLYAQVDVIERSAMRGADLTAQLLSFARRGKRGEGRVDLNAVVQEVVQLLSRTVDRRIAIEARCAPALPLIEGDGGQLHQVLLNLCVNARDAMPAGGSLIIGTTTADLDEGYARAQLESRRGPHVVLSVADTGEGMDAATQTRIFEPFFTTKGPGQGTGLGLAVVYGVVKNHGGHIKVQSEVGRGTTFTIYLPSLPLSTVALERPATAAVVGGNETILVVDDEEAVRSAARDILVSRGYRVLTARDGVEALAIFHGQAESIDLVILDMIMPHLGGVEACRRIKAERPAARVLLCSGYTDDGMHGQGMASGAAALLPKPYRLQELLTIVRRVLDESEP